LKNKFKISFTFFFLKFWNYFVHFRKFKNVKKKYKKKLKIIFIKPYNYLDLYPTTMKSMKKLIFSSNYRIGPVGLFINHKTDYVISNYYNGKKINPNYSFLNKNRLRELKIQKKNSKDIKRIDFNKYDVSISFEDTIPEEYTKKYNKTIWAKIYEDHSNKNYIKNIFSPKKNFDIILNQTLGYTPYSFLRKTHWIDFSYTFGNSNFLKKLGLTTNKSIDIITEVNQSKGIKNKVKNLNFSYKILDEKLNHRQYLSVMSKGKFFLSIDCIKPRWGNSLVEAALCKNLIIGNRNHFWNSHLILGELHCSNLDDAIDLMNLINKNKSLYEYYLNEQTKILDNLNYHRPLTQIYKFSENCKRPLNLKKKYVQKF
jgi:hypothetical protein